MMTTVMFADAAPVVSIAAHHVAAEEVSVVVAGHEDIPAVSPDDACAGLVDPSHSRKKKERAPAESGIASWSLQAAHVLLSAITTLVSRSCSV